MLSLLCVWKQFIAVFLFLKVFLSFLLFACLSALWFYLEKQFCNFLSGKKQDANEQNARMISRLRFNFISFCSKFIHKLKRWNASNLLSFILFMKRKTNVNETNEVCGTRIVYYRNLEKNLLGHDIGESLIFSVLTNECFWRDDKNVAIPLLATKKSRNFKNRFIDHQTIRVTKRNELFFDLH